MKNISIRQAVTYLAAIGIAATVLTIAERTVSTLADNDHWVTHTHTVIDRLSELQQQLGSQNAQVRDYLLTGNLRSLDQAVGIEHTLHDDATVIRNLTLDNPLQQTRTNELEQLLDTRQAIIMKRIEQYRSIRHAGPGRANVSQTAIRLGQSILTLTSEMKQEEERLLVLRTEHMRQSIQTVAGVMLGAALSSLALLGLVVWGFTRHLATRRAAEAIIRAKSDALEEALADNHRILDASLDVICTFDAEGRFIQVSNACETLWGYRAEELMGQLYMDFVAEEDRPLTAEAASLIMSGVPTSNFENRYRRKDGSLISVVWSARWSPKDQRLHCVARDNTERKKIERMQNEFISTVSHELRTPLTSIRGSLALVNAGMAGTLPEQAATLIDIANKNTERLIRLINDILDIEKIESGNMVFRMQPLSLPACMEQAVAATRGYAQEFGVQLEITADGEYRDSALQVIADPDRLEQALANLLSNAIKFSPRGGTVRVDLRRLDADRVRIGVIDQGSGIPVEFHDRIFQKFAQADASDRRAKGGTGLGLSITRSIIEKLGGAISFESAEGTGTSFFVDLPLHRPFRPDETSDAGPPRALICEDDPDVAHLLQLMLSQVGLASDVANSAEEARACLAVRRYHVVTLDLGLPDQDGLTFIRQLKEDPATASLPVVVISARAEEGRRAINGGAMHVVDWLQKPIDPERLQQAMNLALRRQGDRSRVLYVEDDPDLGQVLARILDGHAEVVNASSLQEAQRHLAAGGYDLVVLDVVLPDGNALDLLPALIERSPSTPVLIFSAQDITPDIARQVAATLVKSRTGNDQLLATILNLIDPGRARLPDPA